MKRRNESVFVDIDCTVNNYAELWCKKLNEKFQKNVKYEDITCYDIDKVFQISKKATLSVIDEIFYNELQVLDLVHKNLKYLISEGWYVYFLTSTPPNEVPIKAKWIEENFPYIGSQNVIYSENKSVFSGDYLIDDNIYHINHSQCRNKLLFTQPWNEKFKLFTDTIRVYDWDAIRHVITKKG